MSACLAKGYFRLALGVSTQRSKDLVLVLDKHTAYMIKNMYHIYQYWIYMLHMKVYRKAYSTAEFWVSMHASFQHLCSWMRSNTSNTSLTPRSSKKEQRLAKMNLLSRRIAGICHLRHLALASSLQKLRLIQPEQYTLHNAKCSI